MSTLDELADGRYISLTTYRRDGAGVDTPVWYAVDGGELFVWTNADSWKVRRIRNDPRAVATACTVRGRIEQGAARVEGTARLLDTEADAVHVRSLLVRRYGWQFRITDLSARITRRRVRHPMIAIALVPTSV